MSKFKTTSKLIMSISFTSISFLVLNILSCFQKSKIAKGKRKMVVELCHTMGTNLLKYIFLIIKILKGSGMAKQKNSANAIKMKCVFLRHIISWFCAGFKLTINAFDKLYLKTVAADKTITATKFKILT